MHGLPFVLVTLFFEVAPSDLDTNWLQLWCCGKISSCFVSLWLPGERTPAQL